LGGAKYFVTFVDDYSHKTWAYMMKKKDEVFAKFKIFKNEVEACGQHSLMFQSNNGGEYTNVAFTDFSNKPNLNKLAPHLEPCILLSRDTHVNGYRCY